MIDNETATGATQRQPRNIFEQTLYGLQTVNENVVGLSRDMEAMQRKSEDTAAKIDAIYRALYPSETEPIAPGPEQSIIQ